MLVLLSLLPAAHAFCGTYVGSAGSELYNSASQVALARQGNHTTLTLANDVQGDVSEFAMVVPVPAILSESDVRVVDPALFGRLDGYSAPRLVKYQCSDFAWDYDDAMADGGAGGAESDGGPADGSVTVEAEFAAGEYDIVILSATESDGLVTWLRTNGYGVEADAEELLGEYIASGSYFFAARVALDRAPSGGWLSPLQFEYDSEVWSLPIRLGTLNSPGTQDLVIYTVTNFDAGRTGIANYPEVTVEDECMYRDERYDSFGAFWMEQAEGAFGPGASYLTEYAYGNGHCDPCTGEPPSEEDLAQLGYDTGATEGGDTGWSSGAYYFFTRLHMRYGLVGVDEDVVLYPSNDTSQQQIRYIEHEPFLEDRFPVCGEGLVDNPGSCDDVSDTASGDGLGGDIVYSSRERTEGGCGGCATSGNDGAGWMAGVLAMAGMLVRRRRG